MQAVGEDRVDEADAGAPAQEHVTGEPHWLAEIRKQVSDRLRPFTSTAREFVFHPARFAKRWASGEQFAMNPLWFAVSAVAVITTLASALEELLGVKAHRGVIDNALRTLAPYAYYIEIGVGAHAVLWALGSKRRLSSSIAMSLYSGGTMATLCQLLLMATLAGFTLVKGPAWVAQDETPAAVAISLTILLMVSFGTFYTVFATSMGALHGVGSLRMVFANGVAMLLSSAVCEVLPLPTTHLALRLWEKGHWIFPVLHVRSGF